MPNEKICPICGESFTVPPTRPKQIYCSRDCAVIGRQLNKESPRDTRVNDFIEKLPDFQIVDVLQGNLTHGTTDNRIFVTAKGARSLEGCTFYVVVVKD